MKRVAWWISLVDTYNKYSVLIINRTKYGVRLVSLGMEHSRAVLPFLHRAPYLQEKSKEDRL